ncbi:MAG: hypothetical protein QM638_16295 [Nocardioides sp.]|uniref:hypothetical protein n=1 Tax=Nocardioides sp. TaxID=35761 RepID=UPI0039E301B6
MDSIHEAIARELQRERIDAARSRRVLAVPKPRRTARHTLAASLRRFADTIDS